MELKVVNIGGTLYFRIPKQIADLANITEKQKVILSYDSKSKAITYKQGEAK